MKKILYTFVILSCLAFVFGSCEGPDGPAGPMGPPGYDGAEIVAGVYQFTENLTIPYKNDVLTLSFTNGIPQSDNVLVYRRSEIFKGEEVWKLIPHTIYDYDLTGGDGSINYDYDFTRFDVNIYVNANYLLYTFPDSMVGLQKFRVVVVPGAFARNIDVSDYTTVVNLLNIDQNNIQTIEVNR